MVPRLTALVSVALLVLTGWLLWERMSAPSDGSIVQLSMSPWWGDGIPVHFVLDASSGLRPRDVVVGIDGHPLTALADPVGMAQRSLLEGERFVYAVVRDGVQREVSVRIGDFPVGAFLTGNWSPVLVVGCLLAVAVFVFAQRPADPAANVLLLVASFAVCGTMRWLLGGPVVRLAISGPNLADVAGELALTLLWATAMHLAVVVPGSGLVVTWPRLVGLYALPFGLHGAYLAVVLPGAHGAMEIAGRVAQVSFVPGLVVPAGAAVLLVLSYRSTHDDLSRRRLRWLLYTWVLAAAALLCLWMVPVVLGWSFSFLSERLSPLVALPFTLALGAAVLRYRLFDIEVILRRSLVYGGLTACVVGMYLAATWGLSSMIGQRSILVALLGTCLVAFSAQPLRTYLHRRVGRFIYGERDDPFEVVSRLGQIDAAANSRAALKSLVETLARTLRLPYAAIELRTGNGPATVASCGSPQGTPAVLPLTRGGDVVGHLLLDAGPGREPFGPADQRLLDALMRQVSGAASTLLLTAELQQSREQLVMAREEERRRLHHRLHDGFGPNLAAGAMQMEVAKKLIERDPDRAQDVLEELITRTREVIGDVRNLVYNLRPPALDQLGLAGAIRERAAFLAHSGPLRVVVDEEGKLAELPAAVEVAAFWIAVEAVNNTVRHAEASNCRIRLARNGDLTIEVCDDGRGLPNDAVPGGGLISMRERAEELGGTCRVERNTQSGTTVRARLPIRRQEEPP